MYYVLEIMNENRIKATAHNKNELWMNEINHIKIDSFLVLFYLQNTYETENRQVREKQYKSYLLYMPKKSKNYWWTVKIEK